MDLLKFVSNIGLIKQIKRSGWLRYLPADKVESVADHSCRMALLTIALREQPNVNYLKCM
jgi:5'-deoxynucleotidase YfbR-like HD superfamily hydrolase